MAMKNSWCACAAVGRLAVSSLYTGWKAVHRVHGSDVKLRNTARQLCTAADIGKGCVVGVGQHDATLRLAVCNCQEG